MEKRVITFSVERNIKRPKHSENNVYALYFLERNTLRPGEHKSTNVKVDVTLPQKLEATCILLPSLLNERLHLENCANISNESSITNSNQPFPLPWNIHLELLNINTDKVFRF